jgi:hypothetical protein
MTKVTAHLNTEIGTDNLIYCSTFQLAWNELPGALGGEITLFPESLDALELNKREFTREHLNESCFIALADMVGNGIVEKIRKELKERFNEESKVNFNDLRPSDILAYAFLLKILQFNTPFDKIKNGINFNGKQVEAFGIDKVKRDTQKTKRNQVRVLRYENKDDFILSFKLKEGDYMIIDRVGDRPNSLRATINNTIARAKFPEFLNDGDVLKIPMISFDIEHHFKEMVSRSVLINGIPSEYFIADAVQFIKFDLNEAGAILRSEAAITSRKCAGLREPTPRQLIVDGPFLLYLSESPSKPPYFAAWINDTSLLKP